MRIKVMTEDYKEKTLEYNKLLGLLPPLLFMFFLTITVLTVFFAMVNKSSSSRSIKVKLIIYFYCRWCINQVFKQLLCQEMIQIYLVL